MPITWNNVGQPNLGNPATSLGLGSELLTGGLDRLSNVVEGQQDKVVKKDRATLHAALLDSALKSGGDEKQYLKSSLDLAKESGLTPEQGMAEVEAVRGTLNEMLKPTSEQQEQLTNEQQKISELDTLGQNTLNSMLKSFDLRNPQAMQTVTEMNAFNQNGGIDTVWSGLSSRFKEVDDEYQTRKKINKIAMDGGYDDFVLSRVLEKAALKDESFGWWGSNRINTKQFKDQLAAEKERLDKALKNSEVRQSMQLNFMNGHQQNIQNARENLKALQKQIREQNMGVFTSN